MNPEEAKELELAEPHLTPLTSPRIFSTRRSALTLHLKLCPVILRLQAQ
jgi:hypothetical protein